MERKPSSDDDDNISPSIPRTHLRRVMILGTAFAVATGLLGEVLLTGVRAGPRGSFQGHVSLLMGPVYAVAYLSLEPVRSVLRSLGLESFRVRIPILVLVIYATEWGSGAFYQAIGLEPWHYADGWASDFSGGHITLWYLPLWSALAATIFWIGDRIREVARAVVDAFWPASLR